MTASTCPSCAGPWIGGLDFTHELTCHHTGTEKLGLEMDLERLTPGADLVRDARSGEEMLAEHLGIILGRVAPFHLPGEPASIAAHLRMVVRLVDGERRRISIDGHALSYL